jgi:hypothetical protein
VTGRAAVTGIDESQSCDGACGGLRAYVLRHDAITVEPSGAAGSLRSHDPDRGVRRERFRDQPNARGDAGSFTLTDAAADSFASSTERAELCSADSDGRTVHRA